ncbi:hypothetical protein CK1_04540 [Ruminococcus sp. SR1/5]|nr:hypothetical protein CK1_04540 [Ruminococcus sp. SR1/5]
MDFMDQEQELFSCFCLQDWEK